MSDHPPPPNKPPAEVARPGLLRELARFVWRNMLWWLIPILLAILALGLLVSLKPTGLTPLIYRGF
jgi:hypothetical protein